MFVYPLHSNECVIFIGTWRRSQVTTSAFGSSKLGSSYGVVCFDLYKIKGVGGGVWRDGIPLTILFPKSLFSDVADRIPSILGKWRKNRRTHMHAGHVNNSSAVGHT